MNECRLSSALINLISGVSSEGWREDETVKGANEKTGKGCATEAQTKPNNYCQCNTISDIASLGPT